MSIPNTDLTEIEMCSLIMSQHARGGDAGDCGSRAKCATGKGTLFCWIYKHCLDVCKVQSRRALALGHSTSCTAISRATFRIVYADTQDAWAWSLPSTPGESRTGLCCRAVFFEWVLIDRFIDTKTSHGCSSRAPLPLPRSVDLNEKERNTKEKKTSSFGQLVHKRKPVYATVRIYPGMWRD